MAEANITPAAARAERAEQVLIDRLVQAARIANKALGVPNDSPIVGAVLQAMSIQRLEDRLDNTISRVLADLNMTLTQRR